MQALPHQNSTLSSNIILEVLPRPQYSIINEENYVTEVSPNKQHNGFIEISLMSTFTFKSHNREASN